MRIELYFRNGMLWIVLTENFVWFHNLLTGDCYSITPDALEKLIWKEKLKRNASRQ